MILGSLRQAREDEARRQGSQTRKGIMTTMASSFIYLLIFVNHGLGWRRIFNSHHGSLKTITWVDIGSQSMKA